MKMSFGKRLALVVYWLLSLLVCAAAILCFLRPEWLQECRLFLNGELGGSLTAAILIAAACVYALFAVLAICIILGGRGKKAERGFITVDSSDTGRTRIAISAVEQMIRQAARGVEGVTELKTAIANDADAISINCSVAISSGAHVPTVTMNLQRAIRSYIELNCGVAVREITVSVHTLDDGEGSKHSRKKGGQSAAAIVPVPPVILPENTVGGYGENVADEATDAPAEAEAEAFPEAEPVKLTLDPPTDVEAPEAEDE